jgi:hypothetical protein
MSLGMLVDLVTLGNYIAKKYEITIKKNISDDESEIEVLLIDKYDNEIKGSLKLHTKDRYIVSILSNLLSMFKYE